MKQPVTICLCGSTKFKKQFLEQQFELTMKGYIVLSVGWFSHADAETFTPDEATKKWLDWLHRRKIDKADAIMVINPEGYIGDSTKSEIAYAEATGKLIMAMEPIQWKNFCTIVRSSYPWKETEVPKSMQ